MVLNDKLVLALQTLHCASHKISNNFYCNCNQLTNLILYILFWNTTDLHIPHWVLCAATTSSHCANPSSWSGNILCCSYRHNGFYLMGFVGIACLSYCECARKGIRSFPVLKNDTDLLCYLFWGRCCGKCFIWKFVIKLFLLFL